MREYTSQKRVGRIVDGINRHADFIGMPDQKINLWYKTFGNKWTFQDINGRPIYAREMTTKEVLPFLFGYLNALKIKKGDK